MYLTFEKWMEENIENEQIREIFREAIICYKVSAYRSALIMSYVAFQNVLKYRILNSKFIPTDYPESLCVEIRNKLMDEKIWDETIVDCVKRKNPNRIFLINEDIVKQYEYWRNIRNDCAHGKSNLITYSHIETFWCFIQTYYTKFIINGGKNGLIDMIEKHYDPSLTDPQKSCDYIIENLKVGLLDEEIKDFLDELFELYNSKMWDWGYFDPDGRGNELWSGLLQQNGSKIRNAILEYAKDNNEMLCGLVEMFPNVTTELLDDPKFARKLWTEKLFKLFSWGQAKWLLTEKIIKLDLVPAGEKKGFDKRLYAAFKNELDDQYLNVLQMTGFYNVMKEDLFQDDSQWAAPAGINFANFNSSKIAYYIEKIGLDEDVVKRINNALSFISYGTFYDEIKLLFEQDENLRNSFGEISNKLHLENRVEKIINLKNL